MGQAVKAGTAKVDITPPVGVRLAGYAGRAMPSLAVHDPLWARAIVFDDGQQRVALMSHDLLFVSREMVERVRADAQAAVGISPEGLFTAATHDHSAPRDLDEESTKQEREYWEALPAKLAEVVAEAASDLQPVALGAASGWSSVGINRREHLPGGRVELGRNHLGPFDPELGLVRVERTDGRPLAAIVNYACHAIALQYDNYLLTADYPGYAVHYVEKTIGDGVMGMFFNGACGNVNPREAGVAHSFTGSGGFFVAERAGREIAREASRVWSETTPEPLACIAAASREINLPTNRGRAIAAAEEALQSAEEAASGPQEEWSPYVSWYAPPNPQRQRRRLERLKAEGDAPVECEIQAVRVGPVAFVGWPGEIFCELGMRLKRRSPFSPTYVVSNANGRIGYVPTPEAFPEGGYEVESGLHLADNAGTVLVEESAELLDSLTR